MRAVAQECERAVVIATADPDAHTAIIERHERCQNEIEIARVDLGADLGLHDSEEIGGELCTVLELREGHLHAAQDGYVNALAVPAGGLDESLERRLAVEREIQGDAPGAPVLGKALDKCVDAAIRLDADRVGQRAPLRAQLPPQMPAFRIDGGRDAPRLCRHEPLLSNRSNRWGTPSGLKASRLDRTCTPSPTELNPQ